MNALEPQRQQEKPIKHLLKHVSKVNQMATHNTELFPISCTSVLNDLNFFETCYVTHDIAGYAKPPLITSSSKYNPGEGQGDQQ
mgnify:FL=1